MDLKEKVLDTEINKLKDSIFLNNQPQPNEKSWVEVMVEFFYHFFNKNIAPADLKACHFLNNFDESTILRNFFISGKKLIWRNKNMLKGDSNPANGKLYYIVEKLPKVSRDIF